MNKIVIFLTTVASMFGVNSCMGQSYEVSDEVLDKIIDTDSVLVLDVRQPFEFSSGHVQGSINVPLASVIDSLKLFEGYEKIVVVCRSGGRSDIAINSLRKRGVNNTINAGGWTDLDRLLKNRTNSKE